MAAPNKLFHGAASTVHRPHRVTVRLSDAEHASLARRTHERRMSASDLLREAILDTARETSREEGYRAALEYVARCNGGKGHLPELAARVLKGEA